MITSQAPASEGSSLARAFEVLDLFSIEFPVLKMEDIGNRLKLTRSTGYRYVRDLCDAGLLAPAGGGAYALGPRIIELERQLQLTDPLLHAGQAVMPGLANAHPHCIALLCTLYRDKVLCILHQGPEEILSRGRPIHLRRARGLPFSLFSGAASLAILAHLPPHRARGLFLRYPHPIAEAGLGASWEAFRSALAAIRRAGHVTTMGQINLHLVAVGVPVLVEGGRTVRGSVALITARDRWNDAAEAAAVHSLRAAAEGIAQSLDRGAGRAGAPLARNGRTRHTKVGSIGDARRRK